MDYKENLTEELEYLEKTINFLEAELSKQVELLASRKNKLIESRRDMWEETVHFSNDFDRLVDSNQYLIDEKIQTTIYNNTLNTIAKYERLLKSPYFGRFDFDEDNCDDIEKIYIGFSSVIDSKTGIIMVYDWRSPVSSIFYRYELGDASYNSPCGIIRGKVTLKRQYRIQNSNLKYFFDCSININDEILQEVLSQKTSSKMKNIVKSIQKEQDAVIRDTENELLIVQGAAGSGKTSIALHRIAFLLYQGLNSNLKSRNFIIISPNIMFSKYIAEVLPELGEENVEQITFEDYSLKMLSEKISIESRNAQLEYIITAGDVKKLKVKTESIDFKGSQSFIKLLDRLIDYYMRHLIAFEDIYYDGKTIFTRQQLKALFLDNKINAPIVKRLERIENIIYERIQPLRKKRTEKIEKLVERHGGHEFEIKSFSRLLLLKEFKAFQNKLKKVIEVDYFKIYEKLFTQKDFFSILSSGLDLPDNIEHIICATINNFSDRQIEFEDCAPLLYLKLQLEGSDLFPDIKHVVIDEAQDYSPIQYQVFKRLFKNASFTVLGDVNQTIGRDVSGKLYDYITQVLGRKKSLKLNLNKSYRSSYEITEFTKKILNTDSCIEALQRHEAEPVISFMKDIEDIDNAITSDTETFLELGYESIAILCKTANEARNLHLKLKNSINIKLISSNDDEIQKGITVLPIYLAKGLEFDVALVYNVNSNNYSTDLDRRLLYIACTRALHRLKLYYEGDRSSFI